MIRSKWKLPYIEKSLLSFKPQQKLYTRNSIILPEFLNKTYHIHNGRIFIPVYVTNEKIGHKFGEFVFTKKSAIFKKKK